MDRYKQRNIIVMAIYLDKHKPNFEDFFVPFGRKVRKWSNLPRGMELSIGGVEFAFQPRMICHASDTPARAAASGIKASFEGITHLIPNGPMAKGQVGIRKVNALQHQRENH